MVAPVSADEAWAIGHQPDPVSGQSSTIVPLILHYVSGKWSVYDS